MTEFFQIKYSNNYKNLNEHPQYKVSRVQYDKIGLYLNTCEAGNTQIAKLYILAQGSQVIFF